MSFGEIITGHFACCVYETVVVELAADNRKCTDTPPRDHLKWATFRTIHHTKTTYDPDLTPSACWMRWSGPP